MSIKLLNPELQDVFDPVLLKQMNTQSLIWGPAEKINILFNTVINNKEKCY